MAPITQASLFLFGTAIAQLAFANSVRVFPDSNCTLAGYYDTVTASSDKCEMAYARDSDFHTVGDNPNLYEVWLSLQEQEDEGCALVIGQNSPDAKSPPCGECVILLHKEGTCTQAQLPTEYYTWQCCGQACQDQCGQIPAKRTIGEAVEALEARNAARPDIANLKNRSPLASAPKAKRSDCSFSQSGSLYSQAGTPVKVSDTIVACQSSAGCVQSYTGTVESSFSQTFEVSASAEAGFFEVVSASVSFGYSAAWEESKSVSVSGSYTFKQGQSGYLTFSPLSACALGTFDGADCEGMGIPTGGDARSACVPEMKAGNQINGDINLVTAA